AFVSVDKIPGVCLKLVFDRLDETGGSIDADSFFSPEKKPQQLVEAGEVVHMPMCNKDVTDAQELARSEAAEVTEIEKQGAPLEHEIDVKPGIVEGIVDQRRIEMSRHTSDRLKLYSSLVQFPGLSYS